MRGEVDPEITASLGCIGAITGQQAGKGQEYRVGIIFHNLDCNILQGSGLPPDRDLYFFDATTVRLQDGEFEIPARDDVIDLGDIPGEFQDQPGKGIAFTLYLIEGISRDIHRFADIVQHGPAFEDIAAVLKPAAGGLFFVKFIPDIADHFFQDIFEGDDAAGSAEFINDYGKMDPFVLKFLQKVFDKFMFMD